MMLIPDAHLRVLADGRVLIGFAPLRVLRLSPSAARLATRWLAGGPVGADPAHQELARRLVTAGLAHPCHAHTRWGPQDVTVVIPVRDEPHGVRALRDALHGRHPVLVVDDGSAEPLPGAAARHPAPLGPAAARNTGVLSVTTALVAFLDADVTPGSGWLEPLLAHFEDPRVAAVAPRVRSRPGRSPLARYERARSPLDLGAAPAEVGPGARVGYLPSAALLVRTSVLRELGGFDERMRFGEDVDLIWRLTAAGHRVRYEPASEVLHRPRPNWPALLRQRFGYGTSAGPLARRHGRAVAHARLSPVTAAAWTAGFVGRPRTALALAGVDAALLARELVPAGVPARAALRLAVRGQSAVGRMLADAALRAWWPVALPALLTGRRGRVAVALVLLARLRGRPWALDPMTWCAAGLADDLAYGAGVWWGALRARTAVPLLPDLSTRPRGNDGRRTGFGPQGVRR
ncbi:mycofactocin biosynthesis glycosyltransferase MftF [Streptomyces sp. NBC_01669]|uniref:mycofactocin biosynthesis glycosyltransferase MftF n=1 Tax=Streptomyces sp. NBC_01669 TaxID=2975909 RepID=UPI002253601D|nr:mycofactocin biosynthesis glycosyltransferase MftF [Streptomyces sp. NBC_01669]MCX4530891.1 mycofactocin biosynthesis glycosyltransferase MftF [Streptomyces sp. NBC_01669]